MSASQGAHFSIHPAKKENASDIKKLIFKSGLNPTALDWHNFYIAHDIDGNFIASGQIKSHFDGSMELASLAVKKNWRQQGIASALIIKLLELHPGEIYLMCQSSLGSLYEKYSFQAITESEMPKYFRRISKLAGVLENLRQQGESLLIMRRNGNS